jgi:Fe-S-cluster containining protein
VFALEAAMIAGQEIRPAASPAAADVCVFLENGLCRIYRFRPLLCRGQGLPLAYIDDSAEAEHPCLEISACLMNFPEDTEFAMEELLFLDETNRRLAALNIQYCRQARLEAGRRVPLAAIFSP